MFISVSIKSDVLFGAFFISALKPGSQYVTSARDATRHSVAVCNLAV